ncbi:MAG: HD family phosphohydrolase [Phycisphaerales bacterium]
MSREPTRPSRIDSLVKSVRSRRPDLTEALLGDSGLKARLIDVLATPRLGLGLLVAVVFAVLATITIALTRQQPLVAVSRVMDETRLVRVKVTSIDTAQTAQAREQARQATPRVFVADMALLDSIASSVENLPRLVTGVASVAELPEAVREIFAVTPEGLEALKGEQQEGVPTNAWLQRVSALRGALARQPWLDKQSWKIQGQEGSSPNVKLVVEGQTSLVFRRDLVNVEDEKMLADAAADCARLAGFTGPLRAMVVARLSSSPRPLFTYDAALTAQDQQLASESVGAVIAVNPPGQVIFQRGEKLTQAQSDLYVREMAEHRNGRAPWQLWLEWLGVAAIAGGITSGLAGYTALFCVRAWGRASRMAGIASVLLAGMLAACVVSARRPEFIAVSATVPTVLVSLLMTIAYDRRAALAYGLLHGLLVCVALRANVGTLAVMVTGIACVVWTLKEIRDRGSLVRTSVATAGGVGLATLVVSFVDRPLSEDSLIESITDAGLSSAAVILGGGATLFLLPLIERVFGVTTGMTLIELRDPKQPLLRELQIRAPGTYNHSLNVASIVEAAAEAIGADSLLAYVGALYHDIGKMNKPEYFVENQAGGFNKHDKLSPAMSLLIVVGHVKDGIELAREFKLPRNIQHFIESHHGTTLVEFFYHRARRRADEARGDEADEPQVPDEFEYRYHGPKPRTREAAILMVADAVESAARAMSDPTPSRIESLVRGIANKRLLDGQFDDCEITLRDLNMICDSISRTVASMYHGRISYPGGVEAQRA